MGGVNNVISTIDWIGPFLSINYNSKTFGICGEESIKIRKKVSKIKNEIVIKKILVEQVQCLNASKYNEKSESIWNFL